MDQLVVSSSWWLNYLFRCYTELWAIKDITLIFPGAPLGTFSYKEGRARNEFNKGNVEEILEYGFHFL